VRPPFADRREAGRALGERLAVALRDDAIVLGLPRGGVVVAAEVAAVLDAPLDVLLVRKIGVPGRPELAMGAIAGTGDALQTVRTEDVIGSAGVGPAAFARVRENELTELRRREAAYRGDRPPVRLRDRPVVLADDGLATGASMRAAVAAVRGSGVARITVAVPVGSPRACAVLAGTVEELICLWSPAGFRAVQQGYADFAPTSDDEVRAALASGRRDPS
jgi:putative phosphoribosyl transferase